MLSLKKEQNDIKISRKIANSGTQKLDSARMMGVCICPSPLLIMSYSSFFSYLSPCTPFFPFHKTTFSPKVLIFNLLEFLCHDQMSFFLLCLEKREKISFTTFLTPPSINSPVIQKKVFAHLEGVTLHWCNNCR